MFYFLLFLCRFLCSKCSEELPANMTVKVYEASGRCYQLAPFKNEKQGLCLCLMCTQFKANSNRTGGLQVPPATLTTQRVDATAGEIPRREAAVHPSVRRGSSHQAGTSFSLRRTGYQESPAHSSEPLRTPFPIFLWKFSQPGTCPRASLLPAENPASQGRGKAVAVSCEVSSEVIPGDRFFLRETLQPMPCALRLPEQFIFT